MSGTTTVRSRDWLLTANSDCSGGGKFFLDTVDQETRSRNMRAIQGRMHAPLHRGFTGAFDIASREDYERLRELATHLVASDATTSQLVEDSRKRKVKDKIDLALAYKLAVSKREVISLGRRSMDIVVAFAMWNEQRRLRPRSLSNPRGEDSLHTKLDQLNWLFKGTSISWTLVAVDDGDPNDSASVAEGRAKLHRLGAKVTVLRLGDAIPVATGPLSCLKHVNASHKGGAMLLAALHALELGAEALVYSDCDSSVDLAQVGLLLGPFARKEAGVIAGDNEHPDSVAIRDIVQHGPGVPVIRHMQRSIGRAFEQYGIRQFTAPFKLFSRSALSAVVAAKPSAHTFKWSFDTDWMYAAMKAGIQLKNAPFMLIDSPLESAHTVLGPMMTWRTILVDLVHAARAHGADHDEEMAAVVDDFSDLKSLELILQHIPAQLKGARVDQLGLRSTMTPAALRAWLTTLCKHKRASAKNI